MLRLPDWVDGLFVLLLALYIVGGVPLTPLHGDESMQMYAANDYFTAFIERSPASLMTAPPYPVDSDAHLRILNGSVNRYLIGLSWHLAGGSRADLPPAPGWIWPESYAVNLARGAQPPAPLLLAARLPSALLLAVAVGAIFALAHASAGRASAYAAALIFALHPAILLNGRRALQESAMLAFGLLAVLVALRGWSRTRGGGWRWVLLALCAGLTLASKHSGAALAAAAFVWPLVDALRSRGAVRLRRLGLLGACGLGALAVFIALSPALWNAPPARLLDLLRVRGELLDSQVLAAGGALPLDERLQLLLTEPFLAPLAYYEAPTFAVPDMAAAIARYEAAGLYGWPSSMLLGAVFSLLALAGALTLLCGDKQHPGVGLPLLLGGLLLMASVLASPLAWQRYSLPWVTWACLLAGIGSSSILHIAKRKISAQ